MKSILGSVSTLHRGGYVHRDIKTANIMVNDQKEIFLIDFGSTDSISNLKTVNDLYRSPGYYSPEMFLKDVKCNEVKAADVWAVGIVFYKLLTVNIVSPLSC